MGEHKKLAPKRRFKEFQNADAWKKRKLIEMLVQPITDGPHETPEIVAEGIPFISVDAIVDNQINFTKKRGFISKKYNEQCCKKYNPQFHDVFLVKSGSTVGKTAIVETYERFNIWSPLAAMRCGNKSESYFLYYMLQTKSLQTQVFDKCSHGTQPNLSMKQLEQFDVSRPNIEEQQKIGAFFNHIDRLINLHQRKLEKTKALKAAYLSEMFPQEGERVPKRRFAGFTGAWEQRKLSEIATMHARIGWQNLRTSEFLDSGDYLLITGTDFDDGTINYSTCHYVEQERFEQDRNIQIRNGSILITKDGTLGKVAYVQGLSMPATLNAGVFNVEIKDENTINGKYLFQYLKAPFLMDYVDKKATGGTIKHLNQNILVDFPIVLPTIEEQTALGELFSNLDNLITLHQRKLVKLQNMKKAFLNEMFI